MKDPYNTNTTGVGGSQTPTHDPLEEQLHDILKIDFNFDDMSASEWEEWREEVIPKIKKVFNVNFPLEPILIELVDQCRGSIWEDYKAGIKNPALEEAELSIMAAVQGAVGNVSPPKPDHNLVEEQIHKILEEVYNAGYDCGDGFKPTIMLSTLLYQKRQAILSLLTLAIKEARLDELERMHEKSFGWKRNKQLISGFVEDYHERVAELEGKL